MITKNEYLYSKIKMDKLGNWIFEVENARDTTSKTTEEVQKVVQAYLKWVDLPYHVQQKIIEGWNAFYKECEQGEHAKICFRMAKLWKLVPTPRKEIAELMELSRNTPIPQRKLPSSVDPNVFQYSDIIVTYKKRKAEYEDLKKLVDEYRPVYEPKGDKFNSGL